MNMGFRSPFAHLGRRAPADDPKRDDQAKAGQKAEDEDDDDEKKKKKDEDDDDNKSKSNSKAEDDDDKKKDDDEDDKSKSKKAKAGDDDDDESGTDAKAARGRERARIRAILLSDAGKADPVAAIHVALDTSMPRAEAIGLLTAMSVGRSAEPAAAPGMSSTLRNRMAEVPNPTIGADGGPSGGPSMADRIVAAGKKARGEA